MKRVLLTGVGGFIGAHCLKYFINNTDWFIIGLDSFRHKGTCSRINDISGDCDNRYKILRHDLAVPIDLALENQIMNRRIDERGNLVESKLDYIINLASDSAVERSVTDPGWCWRNNCELMLNMLEFARKVKPKIFWHTSCYDEQTKVMTPSGFKKYNEIKIGDKILSLNSKTGNLEEKTIENVIVQDYEGEMYHFDYARTDIMVTPNHRMYFQNKNGEICFNSAEELLQKKCAYKLPQSKWKSSADSKNITVPGIGEVNAEDLFYLCGIFIGDGFLSKQTKKVKNKSGLKRQEFLNKCRDNSGKFLSTGKIGNEEFSTCLSWRVYIDIPFNDPAFEKCCAVLDRIGISYTKPKNKSGEHIYFSSKEWFNWFLQFGQYAENKHIPNWMLQYGPVYLKRLLEGLLDSDGRNDFTSYYSTCSFALVRDVCELALKLGYFPHFKKKYTEVWFKKEKRIIKGVGYVISICSKHPNFSQKHLKIKKYSGKIWCLKVQDNKNLIVERNGKLAICGNTDEVYGDCPDGYSHPEWDVIMPSNPYAASKAAQEALAISYWRSFDVPVVIGNIMNCIGTGQDKEKFLPKLIWKIASNQEMEIYADPLPDGSHKIGSRYYLHVENHADAIKFCLNRPFAMYKEGAQRPDRYNVVGEIELNNLEMAQMIADIMGKELKYKLVPSESARRGYDRRYALDGSYLREKGWQPPVGFREGLGKIVKWTLDHPWWLV